MLRRKIVIAYAVGGLLIALGASAISFQAKRVQPQSGADEYRLKAQQALQSDVERLLAHNEAWGNLKATEREQLLQPIRERAEIESAEMIKDALRAEATSPAPDSCPFRGLLYPDREPAVPVPFHGWEFRVFNYWGGVLDGVCQGAYAGYSPTNPLQGALAVYSHPDEPSRYELYPTPTATGPIRIIAEANGLLTLSSIGGAFDKNTAPSADGTTFELTKVPGGATYVFDLRTMKYR